MARRLSKAAQAERDESKVKMLDLAGDRYKAATSNAALALYECGTAMLAAIEYGATHKDVATACGIRVNSLGKCPALSNMLRATSMFVAAPTTAADVARFLAYWHGNGARHDAQGVTGAGNASKDALSRLHDALAMMSENYGAKDVMLEVVRVYGVAECRAAMVTAERIAAENAAAEAEAAAPEPVAQVDPQSAEPLAQAA